MPSPAKKHRAIVIEDETVSRQLLGMALSRLPGMEVIGDYADGAEGLQACLRDRPDPSWWTCNFPGCMGWTLRGSCGASCRRRGFWC